MNDDQKILITAAASPIRRAIAAMVLGALAALLLMVAASGEMQMLWQAIYVAFGVASGWGAWKLWQATADVLELTRTTLRTSDGRHLVDLDDVKTVERGAFAFKPSNGFVVILNDAKASNAWAPGLWWRIGRRIGIGGVVSAGQAKAMAEVMIALKTGVFPDDDAFE